MHEASAGSPEERRGGGRILLNFSRKIGQLLDSKKRHENKGGEEKEGRILETVSGQRGTVRAGPSAGPDHSPSVLNAAI